MFPNVWLDVMDKCSYCTARNVVAKYIRKESTPTIYNGGYVFRRLGVVVLFQMIMREPATYVSHSNRNYGLKMH